MTYLYVIRNDDGTLIKETWSQDESLYEENSAWNKMCDVWDMPSDRSIRTRFQIMAERAKHTCDCFVIPDEVIVEAAEKIKVFAEKQQREQERRVPRFIIERFDGRRDISELTAQLEKWQHELGEGWEVTWASDPEREQYGPESIVITKHWPGGVPFEFVETKEG